METCWNVQKWTGKRSYGHLSKEQLEEWAIGQTEKSIKFRKGELEATSVTEPERKAKMLAQLDAAFEERADAEHRELYKEKYREMFEQRLEDPGLLDNFEYFDIPSSDYMIMFYVSTWTGKMADVMIYLHNYGWNLKGEFNEVPMDDVWFHMGAYEGMNISERKKVQILRGKLEEAQDNAFDDEIFNVFSFGGGNEPLRLYGPEPFNTMPDTVWYIFDDGDVRDREVIKQIESYSNGYSDVRVQYYHENLFRAVEHRELYSKGNFGYMFGVSMYLGQEFLEKALLIAHTLLKLGGMMMFDVLLWTDSMRRVIETQGWPKGKNEMYIFNSVDEALSAVREIIDHINWKVEPRHLDIEEVQPILIEPWGVTSIVFTLRKT